MSPNSYAVLDFETTGLSNKDRVLEVGVVLLDSNFEVEGEWESLIQPGRDLGSSPKVHGITPTLLVDAPTFSQVAGELFSLLDGRVIVAHNAPFDGRFLRNEAQRLGIALSDVSTWALCTRKLSRAVFPSLPSYTLESCLEVIGVENDNAHAALGDVRATVQLLTTLQRFDPYEFENLLPHPLVLRPSQREILLALESAEPMTRDQAKAGAQHTKNRIGRSKSWKNAKNESFVLEQGQRVCFTGAMRLRRSEWETRCADVGLSTGGISRKTVLLVAADQNSMSGKARKARELQIPIVDEKTFERMLRKLANQPTKSVSQPPTSSPDDRSNDIDCSSSDNWDRPTCIHLFPWLPQVSNMGTLSVQQIVQLWQQYFSAVPLLQLSPFLSKNAPDALGIGSVLMRTWHAAYPDELLASASDLLSLQGFGKSKLLSILEGLVHEAYVGAQEMEAVGLVPAEVATPPNDSSMDDIYSFGEEDKDEWGLELSFDDLPETQMDQQWRKEPESTPNLYKVGDVWLYLLTVSGDYFTENSFKLPYGVQTALDIPLRTQRMVHSVQGNLTLSDFGAGLMMSSIQDLLKAHRILRGDRIFLIFDGDTVDVIRTTAVDASASGISKVLNQLGVDVLVPDSSAASGLSAEQAVDFLTGILFLPANSTRRAVVHRFRSRQQDDIADAIIAF